MLRIAGCWAEIFCGHSWVLQAKNNRKYFSQIFLKYFISTGNAGLVNNYHRRNEEKKFLKFLGGIFL